MGLKISLQANDIWQLWYIDENLNQLVKIKFDLLLIYFFMRKQFSILTLLAILIILAQWNTAQKNEVLHQQFPQ